MIAKGQAALAEFDRDEIDGCASKELGMVFFYGIVALVALVQISYFTHPQPAGEYIGLFVVDTALLALAASLQVALRGTWGDVARTPMEALAAMDRRHAGRLRLGRFMPWGMAYVLAGAVCASMVDAGHGHPVSALDTSVVLVLCASSASFAWLANRWVKAKIDRDLREVKEARKMLTAGESGAAG
jgi:hypothetical protein